MESEIYSGADDLPAPDINKRYGYRNEYDADRHVTAVICPDSYRNTLNNSDHYAIIKITYYDDGEELRNSAVRNDSFSLNRYKSPIPIDISYYSALIASIFEQRVFKEAYEEPQNVRYIIFRFGPITKKRTTR